MIRPNNQQIIRSNPNYIYQEKVHPYPQKPIFNKTISTLPTFSTFNEINNGRPVEVIGHFRNPSIQVQE